ncbi:MAG TPA: Abi-alpha family protein [Pyrinomonadaceae bacterium]|nr:Abi-alpha family protein [Pyrinomonadaceae bacterium]
MPDEITVSAKAVQETVKTVRTGIEATQQLGRFVSRITTEPLETVMGILNDKLQFMRWERKLRLAQRGREIIDKRGIEGPLRPIPYKLALPIIENASLEDNDELQDLWANLLASAVDPNFDGVIRTAYIDIIRQLEVIDVHVLNVVHKAYGKWLDERKREQIIDGYYFSPIRNPVSKVDITEQLGITFAVYENAVDNLMRVRCLASYVADETIQTEFFDMPREEAVTIDHRYEFVCITSLGVSFVEACAASSR